MRPAGRVRHREHNWCLTIRSKAKCVKCSSKRQAIYRRDGHRCQFCRTHRDKLGNHNRLTLDHIVPRCFGGSNDPTNLLTACNDCNSRRGHMLLGDFVGPETAAALMEQAAVPLKNPDGSPWSPYLGPIPEVSR